jgi:hypothetical protein
VAAPPRSAGSGRGRQPPQAARAHLNNAQLLTTAVKRHTSPIRDVAAGACYHRGRPARLPPLARAGRRRRLARRGGPLRGRAGASCHAGQRRRAGAPFSGREREGNPEHLGPHPNTTTHRRQQPLLDVPTVTRTTHASCAGRRAARETRSGSSFRIPPFPGTSPRVGRLLAAAGSEEPPRFRATFFHARSPAWCCSSWPRARHRHRSELDAFGKTEPMRQRTANKPDRDFRASGEPELADNRASEASPLHVTPPHADERAPCLYQGAVFGHEGAALRPRRSVSVGPCVASPKNRPQGAERGSESSRLPPGPAV